MMKNRLISLLFVSLLGMCAFAQTVSEPVAQSRAAAFFANQAQHAPGAIRDASHDNDALSLAYTSQGNGNTRFYVYNRGEKGGYVIVGGDEQAKEILAYIPQGHFAYDSLPTNMKWWLGQYEHEIDTTIILASHMPAIKSLHQTATQNTMQDVPDMITTKWNQRKPYYNAIPLVFVEGDTVHCPAGCVPTAFAQIMKYWEYPTHGIGNKSYSHTYVDINQTVTFSADFANTTYDWSHMRDTYVEGQYTEQEALAVATLMYHIGVALNVEYHDCSSGYWSIEDANGILGTTGLMRDLPKYFGYDEGLEDLYREDFTAEQWKTLLYNEMVSGRPVYYSGIGSGGHGFVCHGYSSTLDMFSFNWGWGGVSDGYYALSGTKDAPGVNGYTMDQRMLIGIRPPGYNTSPTHLCYGDKFLYNNVWYKVYDEHNLQVEVTHPEIADGFGQTNYNPSDYNYCSGVVAIPSVVDHNGILYTVSRIGSYAFLEVNSIRPKLTCISLPFTIKSFGEGAFYGCQSLRDSMFLPDSIEIIPRRCFEECLNVPYFRIPDLVKSIGFCGFNNCNSIEQITLPEGCYKLSPCAFFACPRLSIVNLPSTIRIFGDQCFKATSLLKMTFPCDSFVPARYYEDYEYMTTISFVSPFPNSIEKGTLYVPSALVDTFRNTTDEFWRKWGTVASLDSVNPNIGKRFIVDEFEYQICNDSCVQLTTIDHEYQSKNTLIVPANVSHEGSQYKVETIVASAFSYKVWSTDTLILSEGIRLIEEAAFVNCMFRAIKLPNSLEKIGERAFYQCFNLESLEIPGSVKIAQGVSYCDALKQIILHDGTTCLGPNFLVDCQKLEHVFFPKSIWYSSGGTLVNCGSLRSIVSLTDSFAIAEAFSSKYGYDKIGELVGVWSDGYGSNHESVNMFIPDSLLQDPNSDYNNNYPWNQFANKLSYVPMTSFDIPDTLSVVHQEQFVVPTQFSPTNASYQMLKWTSSDESIVSVNCEGVAFAHGVGSAVITASAIDGSTMARSCVINVREMSIPSDSDSFYTYLPTEVFISNPDRRFDTVAIPISSNGDDVFVAFDLRRERKSSSLIFSVAGQIFDISLSGQFNDVILRFANVGIVDTLWIRWKDQKSGVGLQDYVTVKNIRVWNKYSQRYPVRFVNEDGQVLQDSLYQYGSVPEYFGSTPTKPSTAEYHFVFAGWTPALAEVTGDATYTATFDSVVNTYVVMFLNDDSTLLQLDTLAYGAMPVFRGATPTKPATAQYTYTFTGWNVPVESVIGNATYIATFTSSVNKYIVTFVDEDGVTILQRDTLEYGFVPAYRGVEPTKAATAQYTYTFAGWSPVVVSVIGNATYAAVYTSTINRYVVIFRNEDSTLLQIDTLAYGALPEYRGATPTKASTQEETYYFAGWSPVVVSVVGDAVYTATFTQTINKYVVTFSDETGVLQRDTLNYGSMPVYRGETPAKPATVQYTYIFKAWSPVITSVTEDATYTATFDSIVNKYVVIFQDEDSTLLQIDTLNYGVMPEYSGVTPTKAATPQYSYTFGGWNTAIVPVTGNAIYTATYTSTVNKYVVSFFGNDLLQHDTLDYGSIPVYRGATPVKPATAQYTYTFAGWSPLITPVYNDANYVATFDSIVNTYVVIFQNEDSTLLQIDTLAYGLLPEFRGATPTKPATAQYTYTFAGWNEPIVLVTSDAVYTATYTSTINKYVITFVDESGTVLQLDSLDYGTMPSFRDTLPTKPSTAEYHFVFAGWTPALAEVTGDATYTATFDSIVNTYVIMFLNDDSTLLQIDTLEYGAMPVFLDSIPTKEPDSLFTYIFDGWAPEIVSVTQDATYVATYRSTATNMPLIPEDKKPVKIWQDGKMYILLPNGQVFDSTGKRIE